MKTLQEIQARIEEPVTRTIAYTVIDNYSLHSFRHIKEEIGGKNVLTEFRFNKNVIMDIINNGAAHVFMKFGYHLDTNMNNSRKGYTIIALGLKDDNNLMLADDDFFADALNTNNTYLTRSQFSDLVDNYNDERTIQYTLDQNKDLQGHYFPKQEFEYLVNKMGAVAFELVLGYHVNPTPDHLQTGYSWMLFGLDANGRRMESPISGHRIFDFCEPCPNVCPDNVAAI